MLKAAIRDDNPVLVLEHKALLSMKGPVPVGSDDAEMPTGPRILRPGRDVTIVASLAMVGKALAAADMLQAEGIAAEVIDIRVLRPLDVGADQRERPAHQHPRHRRGAVADRRLELGRGRRRGQPGLRLSRRAAGPHHPPRPSAPLQPEPRGRAHPLARDESPRP